MEQKDKSYLFLFHPLSILLKHEMATPGRKCSSLCIIVNIKHVYASNMQANKGTEMCSLPQITPMFCFYSRIMTVMLFMLLQYLFSVLGSIDCSNCRNSLMIAVYTHNGWISDTNFTSYKLSYRSLLPIFLTKHLIIFHFLLHQT